MVDTFLTKKKYKDFFRKTYQLYNKTRIAPGFMILAFPCLAAINCPFTALQIPPGMNDLYYIYKIHFIKITNISIEIMIESNKDIFPILITRFEYDFFITSFFLSNIFKIK